MTKQRLIIPESISEYISYNEHTGELVWIKSPSKSVKIGTTIQCIHTGKTGKQYYTVKFKNKLYTAHRVAWFLKTGKQPEKDIDHIDCNSLNNKWCNLRNASALQNSQNRVISTASKSGYKGVSWHKINNKWSARIMYCNRRIHLGYFDTPEEAHVSYCLAADSYHKEFANYGNTV